MSSFYEPNTSNSNTELSESLSCRTAAQVERNCGLNQSEPIECRYQEPNQEFYVFDESGLRIPFQHPSNPWLNDLRCATFTTSLCGIPMSNTEVSGLMVDIYQRGESPRAAISTFCSLRPCQLAPRSFADEANPADGWNGCSMKASCEPNIIE